MRPLDFDTTIPPRAMVGRVRANVRPPAGMLRAGAATVHADADPKAVLASLNAAFGEFRDRNDARVAALESAVDGQAIQIAGHGLNGGGPVARVDDPDYSRQFAGYVRSGGDPDVQASLRTANLSGQRGQINAAMSEGSAADGGYLAPAEWDRMVHKAQIAISPMRRLSQVQTTAVQAFTTLWSDNGWGSGWVGETAARPVTTNAQLAPITFAQGEIYAMPAVTQRLLDDGLIDVAQWLATELAMQFDTQEGIAFISGNGTNKPFGLLQYVTGGAAAAVHPGGVLDVVNSGNATTIPGMDVLKDFSYGLLAPYRQNATWLMSSATAGVLSKLKDSTGAYLWQPATLAGQPDTLMGRPVELDENMPAVAAGNLAVAFGDFRAGYLINDRQGIRVLRDPYTNKPFVSFYSTRRVGGGVLDPRAIRLLKISA